MNWFRLLVVAAFLAAASSYLVYSTIYEPSEGVETTVTVYMREYYYLPDEVHVRRNVKTLIVFVNDGAYPHNAYLSEEKRDLTPVMYPGNKTSVEVLFRQSGVYSVLCTVAYPAPVSHYELGMRARLVVR